MFGHLGNRFLSRVGKVVRILQPIKSSAGLEPVLLHGVDLKHMSARRRLFDLEFSLLFVCLFQHAHSTVGDMDWRLCA